ncbi:MAG: hypothetical protein ACOZQL_14855, partial [Myxococcota bacterium]
MRIVPSALLLASSLALAHPVTVDGSPAEWSARTPNADNLGLVVRDANGRGEWVWRDALADTRTDLSMPEVVADIASFQVTGDATGVFFLLRRTPGASLSGAPIQVQIAVDLDRVPGSGQSYLAGFSDTQVADGARWERLVQTLFGSGGTAQVFDAAFTQVAAVPAAVGAAGDVELFVPWSALGLSAPPTTPLRLSIATFRAQTNDLTIDLGGAMISNALDVVSTYGDPRAAMNPNTWTEVQDQVLDASFDVWFASSGEVVAPLVVQAFLPSASASGSDEWYVLRNVTATALSLEVFRFGDEETPDQNEGMYALPSFTLAPGASFTVARSGAAYQAFFGRAPDAELPPGSSAAIPDLTPWAAWLNGTTGTGLQLVNAGDELLLIDASGTVLDVAVFGTGVYAGVTAFTPAPGTDQVLSRSAASADTDDCLVDFTNRGPTCVSDATCGACFQCSANLCAPRAAGASCADANLCNGTEACDGAGVCGAGTPLTCDDANACTTDTCAPATGCQHAPVTQGTSCSDGDLCNGTETCNGNGGCTAGTPLDCNDSNACSLDGCSPAIGCTHGNAPSGTSCADGNACNGAESCNASQVCLAGTPLDCNDQNPCTLDACDVALGCTHAPNSGASCADNNVCNGAETCSASGVCMPGAGLDCSDGNPCTLDSCNAVTGCQHAVQAGISCTLGGCAGTCSASGACVCADGGSGGGAGGGGGGGSV